MSKLSKFPLCIGMPPNKTTTGEDTSDAGEIEIFNALDSESEPQDSPRKELKDGCALCLSWPVHKLGTSFLIQAKLMTWKC